MSNRLPSVLVFVAMVPLAACTGGRAPSVCQGVPAPVAVTGPDQQVARNIVVTLSGQASHGSGSGVLRYSWAIESRPAGSTATLTTPDAVSTTLWPDLRGDYVLALVVNDGCHDSKPARVIVTLLNSPPSVMFFLIGNVPVFLPVSITPNVWDPDGDPLTYSWSVPVQPAGSAVTFTDPTATHQTFTPNVPGSYTVQLAVSDGLDTGTAWTTFDAIDYPPVAVAGADQVATIGSTVRLDGTFSADPNMTPLAFAWVLERPVGSAAMLIGADTATPSFVADLAGSYRATLTVTSGGQASSASVGVTAWHTVERFKHRILDAAYSDALDQIVMVAADPAALYLFDPRNGDETQVALTLTPSALALSPDGLKAAVGHAGAITSVDLAAGTAEPPVAVSFDVADLVLGSGRVAWAVPRAISTTEVADIVAVSLDGASEVPVTTGLIGAPRMRSRPGTADLYLAGIDASTFMDSVEHYTVTDTGPALAKAASDSYSTTCGDLWLSQDGTRLFTSCGQVLRASTSLVEDLTTLGTLTTMNIYTFGTRHLSDSTAAGEFSAITTKDVFYGLGSDVVLRRWSAADLTQLEVLDLPTESVGTTPYRWGGRFVFYRSDGTARYVLLQLDPASGVLQDFGWVTF